MFRWLGYSGIAALVALASGVALGFAAPEEQLGVLFTDADEAFEREQALATENGLSVFDARTTSEGLSQTVALARGDCVALIAVVAGPGELTQSSISIAGGGVSLTEPHDITHHAICAFEPTQATVSFSLDGAEAFGSTTVRYAIFTGPVPELFESYDRLTVTPTYRAELITERARRRATALSSGTPLGTFAVSTDRAVLIPANTATYAGRRALSAGSIPSIVPDAAPDPFATAGERTENPIAHTRAGRGRLLAVVDPGALLDHRRAGFPSGVPSPRGCVQVVLARLDEATQAVPIWRITLPSLDEVVLPAADPIAATDTLCAPDALVLYVTDEGSGGNYELSLGAVPSTGREPVLASDYEGAPLALPEVVDLRGRCAADDDASCIALAGFAEVGSFGAGTVPDALGPVCERSGGTACALLALHYLGDPRPREHARAAALERRACATGDLPTCLRRALRFRESGQLEDSLSTYLFACQRGSAPACTSAELFATWQLVPNPNRPAPTPDALP